MSSSWKTKKNKMYRTSNHESKSVWESEEQNGNKGWRGEGQLRWSSNNEVVVVIVIDAVVAVVVVVVVVF